MVTAVLMTPVIFSESSERLLKGNSNSNKSFKGVRLIVTGVWVRFAVPHSYVLNIVHVRITTQQMVTFMLAVFAVTNLYQPCLSSPHILLHQHVLC